MEPDLPQRPDAARNDPAGRGDDDAVRQQQRRCEPGVGLRHGKQRQRVDTDDYGAEDRGGTLTLSQQYWYDGVNRLAPVSGVSPYSVTESVSGTTAWWIQDGYDQYGNRWATTSFSESTLTPTAAAQFDATTNRIARQQDGTLLPTQPSGSTPAAYDGVGNLQYYPNAWTMQYDGENRLVQYEPNPSSRVLRRMSTTAKGGACGR